MRVIAEYNPKHDEIAEFESRHETPDTGERRLAVAILYDGVNAVRAEKRKNQPGEGHEWLSSEDRGWIYSFLNVCHFLGVDPEYVRRNLLAQGQAKAIFTSRSVRRFTPVLAPRRKMVLARGNLTA